MVSMAVTTVHSHTRRPVCRQPVSSRFATGACCTTVRASATTGAGAALIVCSSALTDPTATLTPNTSPTQAAAFRLESR